MCQDVRIYEEFNFDFYGIVVRGVFLRYLDKRIFPAQ